MLKTPVLLSAFACDPKTGSEPYVGWNWAIMLAEDFDVHVLTRTYSRHLIEGHPLSGKINFHYFDLPFWSGRNHHSRFIKLYYILWQALAIFVVLRLNIRFRYKIIHHLTYNNIDVPGLLWLCPGASFVWGPVGGGQVPPTSLHAVYGRHWWKEMLRGGLKATARYNPIVRLATRKARLVFVANRETERRLSGMPKRTKLMLETAVSDLAEPMEKDEVTKIQVLWLSHVFHRKAPSLAVEAFNEAHAKSSVPMELVLVGDGPALEEVKAKVRGLAARHDIKVMGAAPYEAVQRHMRSADIFLFTSVQDTSGNVVLEAMRAGLPVVALDHQGAQAILSHGGGILVPVSYYDQTRTGLAEAILELATKEERRTSIGSEARRQVLAHHSWAAKRVQVVEEYNNILGSPA